MNNDLGFGGLIIPKNVIVENIGKNKCKFSFSPLENGFGVTIGNAFRRVLLSRIKGYAVYAIQIPNVEHEFSSITGVVEDVVEIVLNLKKLSIKKISDEVDFENIKIKINKGVFTGKDINDFSKNFKIVNTDLEICHFSKNIDFEITLYVNGGYGFEIANNSNINDGGNRIYIDTIYSPVKNVAFDVSDVRVENRLDYNSLTLTVETNGALTPEQAVKEAGGILVKHFCLFTNEGTVIQKDSIDNSEKFLDINELKIKELLNKPISSFELFFSRRALNCLNDSEIIYLKDLVKLSKDEVLHIANLGKKTMGEINNFLEANNLQLGMDISEYGL